MAESGSETARDAEVATDGRLGAEPASDGGPGAAVASEVGAGLQPVSSPGGTPTRVGTAVAGSGLAGSGLGVPGLGAVAVFSRGIRRIPHLEAFVGAERLVWRPSGKAADRPVSALGDGPISAVVGWGHKPSAARARAFAEEHRLPYLRLEDGFIRSVGLGVAGEPPLSLVCDDLGIYYDARSPSRLEAWLGGAGSEGPDPLDDPALVARAGACRERMVRHGISKYNDAPSDARPALLGLGRECVLVVDQTRGDASIEQGLASAESFSLMLAAALAEHPDATVVVKTHPDVVAGKKQGHFAADSLPPRVRLLSSHVTPAALFERCRHVYVCTSQLGFEALLHGLPVTCFGVPFYAGWGLTDDRAPVARRGRVRSLDQLVAAALLLYPRYVDPATGRRCQLEQVLELLELQRARFAENTGSWLCYGIARWKRPHVRACLRSPGGSIRFASSPRHVAAHALLPEPKVLVWGREETPALRRAAGLAGLRLHRMEDGFLRSVGLGSDVTAPASLVVDARGIYYDPASPSALEELLEHRRFTPDDLRRAAALREAIVAGRVSKYNPQGVAGRLDLGADGRRVVLVPGQVEDDASVLLGCSEVRTNLGLLEAARRAAPSALLVFKPHPDVLSRNRRGAVSEQDTQRLCDRVVVDLSLPACLEAADEVHTMTSLVGFEALLRGKHVVVHGAPFYAGWGLTEDRVRLVRRTRRLELDELVAGALLHYPRYLDPVTRVFTTPERVVDYLREAATQQGVARDVIAVDAPRVSRQARRALHALRSMLGR